MPAILFVPNLKPQSLTSLKFALNSANIEHHVFTEKPLALNAILTCPAGTPLFVGTEPEFVDIIHATRKHAGHTLALVMLSRKLSHLPDDVRNEICGDAFVAQENDRFDIPEILIILNKFLSGNIFGLDHYVSSRISTSQYMVNNRDSKDLVLGRIFDGVMEYGQDILGSKFRFFAQRISTIADELIMNSVFHANPRLQAEDRSCNFELAAQECVSVEWRYDGRYFGLSVSDQFGNLEKNTVLRYLTHLFPATMTQQRKTGGVGLKYVYEQIEKLVVNVDRGRRTEIICLVSMLMPKRTNLKTPKSFHYFTPKNSVS